MSLFFLFSLCMIIHVHTQSIWTVPPLQMPISNALMIPAFDADSNSILLIGGNYSTSLVEFTITPNSFIMHPNLQWSIQRNAQTSTQKGNIVYILTHTNRQIGAFDIITRSWNASYTLTPRDTNGVPCVASFANLMFVTGGSAEGSGQFQFFDLQSKQWHHTNYNASPMLAARSKHGCAVSNNYLYVLGGEDGVGNYLKTIERINVLGSPIDVRSRYWSFMPAELPTAQINMFAVSHFQYIYVVGGRGISPTLNIGVNIVNTETNEVVPGNPLPVNVDRVAALKVGSTLYVFGGFNDSVVASDAFQFTEVMLPPTLPPTRYPSGGPSAEPTPMPTPNAVQTPSPTEPTPSPNAVLTPSPTEPTYSPNTVLTPSPTQPTPSPNAVLTPSPSRPPSNNTVLTPSPTQPTPSPNAVHTPSPTQSTTNAVHTPSPTQSTTNAVLTPSPTQSTTNAVHTPSPTQPTYSPNAVLTPSPTQPTLSPTFSPNTVLTPSPSRPPSNNTVLTPSPTQTTYSPNTVITPSPTLSTTTQYPSGGPSEEPTPMPTSIPSSSPTRNPSIAPTDVPTTYSPTTLPTTFPTIINATSSPSGGPSAGPTSIPSSFIMPTRFPTYSPTVHVFTNPPTQFPTNINATSIPSSSPTLSPTDVANINATRYPSNAPSQESTPNTTQITIPSRPPTQSPTTTYPPTLIVNTINTNSSTGSPTNIVTSSPTNSLTLLSSASPTNTSAPTAVTMTSPPTTTCSVDDDCAANAYCHFPPACNPFASALSGDLSAKSCEGYCADEDNFCTDEDVIGGLSTFRTDSDCDFCFCRDRGARICNDVETMDENMKHDADFRAGFDVLCKYGDYKDLEDHTLGPMAATQCQFKDVTIKCAAEVRECWCSRFICKTNDEYSVQCVGEDGDTGTAMKMQIMFGISFVMAMYLWM